MFKSSKGCSKHQGRCKEDVVDECRVNLTVMALRNVKITLSNSLADMHEYYGSTRSYPLIVFRKSNTFHYTEAINNIGLNFKHVAVLHQREHV